MNKRILYTDPVTGNLCIVVPAPQARKEGETDDDFLARVAARAVPMDVPTVVVDAADVPADRTFRDAWELNGSDKKIRVHMGKAREIRKRQILGYDIIRNGKMVHVPGERDERLTELATELEAALDAEDKQKEKAIRTKRKALRGLDAMNLDGIATVEELKDHRPPELA